MRCRKGGPQGAGRQNPAIMRAHRRRLDAAGGRNLIAPGIWWRAFKTISREPRTSPAPTRKSESRYENVQHHLSEFDRELRRDHFDKGKLDAAIDNLKDVVKNNTLESHDRDALASDLSDLRTLRDIR